MTNKFISRVTQKDNFKLRRDKLNTVASEATYEEYDDLASFPVTGVADRLYMAKDTNGLYRWDGATYVSVSSAGGGGSGNSYTPSGW